MPDDPIIPSSQAALMLAKLDRIEALLEDLIRRGPPNYYGAIDLPAILGGERAIELAPAQPNRNQRPLT